MNEIHDRSTDFAKKKNHLESHDLYGTSYATQLSYV